MTRDYQQGHYIATWREHKDKEDKDVDGKCDTRSRRKRYGHENGHGY